MNLKSANRWQNILLFGGFVIGMVGIAVLDNTLHRDPGPCDDGRCPSSCGGCYHRCPYCHEQLGRGNPKRCPKCGAWIADEPEPEEKKKIQHKKKKH